MTFIFWAGKARTPISRHQKSMTYQLVNSPILIIKIKKMLARGIEPLFPRLQIECITNYARPTQNSLNFEFRKKSGLNPSLDPGTYRSGERHLRSRRVQTGGPLRRSIKNIRLVRFELTLFYTQSKCLTRLGYNLFIGFSSHPLGWEGKDRIRSPEFSP